MVSCEPDDSGMWSSVSDLSTKYCCPVDGCLCCLLVGGGDSVLAEFRKVEVVPEKNNHVRIDHPRNVESKGNSFFIMCWLQLVLSVSEVPDLGIGKNDAALHFRLDRLAPIAGNEDLR